MKLSIQIKPISYLKAHAAEIVRNLWKQGGPLVITQNGEAKVVMQDIESYEQDAGDHGVAENIGAWHSSDRRKQGSTSRRCHQAAAEAAGNSLMSFSVLLTDDAARDLEDLCDYIDLHDVPYKADYVLEQIEKACSSLSEKTHRGAYPKELLSIGVREYREIFFKPYRIIYRVIENNVYVLLIADGRRDMQTLLQRRLLT